MTLQSDTGIILSASVTGEADILASVLCRNEGRKTFLFKGLKKSTRRPRTAGDPGSVLNLVFRDRKEDLIIPSEFSLVRYFSGIRKNFSRISCAAFILELTEKIIPSSRPGEKIFPLLLGALGSLENTEWPEGLAAFYIIHALRTEGILPDPQDLCREAPDFIRLALNTKFASANSSVIPPAELRNLIIRMTDYVCRYYSTEIKSVSMLFQKI